ncbi:hypothetical protein [Burkholderia cenocepacia]|uniref:hypothetical protein n=1 Tax=Burkholderia cenocepacia TaxID=95486 RepID=UPI000761FFA2|nr:hypothetical protein [Burkholderia cenocepacia]KWU23392.1 hypothetical protein AS149_37015 [Burkholderia cenocepacia]
MKQFRNFAALAAFVAISSLTTAAMAQAQAPVPGSLESIAPAADETAYEQMTQSPVAFWRGMSRKEFEARTAAGPQGHRSLAFGPYVFVTGVVSFDDAGNLASLSLEYRNDDPAQIHAAFEAYRHALGAIKPDYERQGTPTDDVPDLDFAMIGWKNRNGAESALARLHSFEAARAAKTPVKAGVVTFVVRPTR